MKRITLRKVLGPAGGVLIFIGLLLAFGSYVAFLIGPEKLSEFFEKSAWVIPYFLVGVGLLVLGSVLVSIWGPPLTATAAQPPPGAAPDENGWVRAIVDSVASAVGTAPSPVPQGKIRCGKCEALNDGHAKFCNQCGAAV